MTETNENFTIDQATEDALSSLDGDGFEVVAGAAVGAGVAGVAAFKLGYAAGVKDAANACKKDPKAVLKDIRAMKGKKPKKGGILGTGIALQSPFRKVTVEEPKPQDAGTEGSNDSEANKE